jgi:CRISPR-associated exonuclease Cas4
MLNGTQISYYFYCRRRLWYFSHNLFMEHESDTVSMGKLIHETSYDREKKEIELDAIKIDFFDLKDGVLHEVKKSDSFEEAHKWQVLYYLFTLKQRGVNCIKGEIDYPKLKKCVEVFLTTELESELKSIIKNIEDIVKLSKPPEIEVKFKLCKSCSYLELCYA